MASASSAGGAPSSSAIDKAWADSRKGKKERRALSRKTTETEVQKAIYDSLKGMRPEEIDGNRDSLGRTAREVIAERKRLHRTDAAKYPMGARFYNEVRKQFQTKDRPEDRLVATESDGPVSPQLLAAMVQYKKSANRATLAGCLTMLTKASRTDLVGVLRWALELRPGASTDQLRYAMDVARFCVRLNLQALYPDDIACMVGWFDDLFLLIFSRCKGEQTKPSIFLDIYSDIVYLVLPKSATEKIMKHRGPFSEVESELVQAASSKLGMALFGSSLHGVLSERVQNEIQEGLKVLKATPQIKAETVLSEQRRIVEVLQSKPYYNLIPEKRLVNLNYRGRVFDFAVRSVVEHVEAAMMVMLKGVAAGRGQIPGLSCESDLIEVGLETCGILAPEVVSSWKLARESANAGMGTSKDSASIVAYLVKNEGSLVSIDKGFKADICFMKAMVGDAGETALQIKIMQILPTQTRSSSLDEAFCALQALQSTDLHAFVSSSTQGMVKNVLTWVQSLLHGKRPGFVVNPTEFLDEVKLQLQYFARVTTDKEEELVGRAAVEHSFKAVAAKPGGEVSIDELEIPVKFSWLLDEAANKQLGDLVTIAMAKTKNDLGIVVAKAEAQKRALAEVEQDAPFSKRPKHKNTNETEVSAAMAMFRGM